MHRNGNRPLGLCGIIFKRYWRNSAFLTKSFKNYLCAVIWGSWKNDSWPTMDNAYGTRVETRIGMATHFRHVINWLRFRFCSSSWESLLVKSTLHLSPLELECCYRFVDLCRQALFIVYRYSINEKNSHRRPEYRRETMRIGRSWSFLHPCFWCSRMKINIFLRATCSTSCLLMVATHGYFTVDRIDNFYRRGD